MEIETGGGGCGAVAVLLLLLVVALVAVMILPGVIDDWESGRRAESSARQAEARAREVEAEQITERTTARYQHSETMFQMWSLAWGAIVFSPTGLIVALGGLLLLVWWLTRPVPR